MIGTNIAHVLKRAMMLCAYGGLVRGKSEEQFLATVSALASDCYQAAERRFLKQRAAGSERG